MVNTPVMSYKDVVANSPTTNPQSSVETRQGQGQPPGQENRELTEVAIEIEPEESWPQPQGKGGTLQEKGRKPTEDGQRNLEGTKPDQPNTVFDMADQSTQKGHKPGTDKYLFPDHNSVPGGGKSRRRPKTGNL